MRKTPFKISVGVLTLNGIFLYNNNLYTSFGSMIYYNYINILEYDKKNNTININDIGKTAFNLDPIFRT